MLSWSRFESGEFEMLSCARGVVAGRKNDFVGE